MSQRLIVILALSVALAVAILFGVRQCSNARQATTVARTSAGQADAVSSNAADAIGTVGGVSGRSGDTDQTTMENADAIRSAPGAGAPVDPGVRDAGTGSLCKRAAYRGDAKCVRFTAPARVAEPGAGGTAP